MLPSAASPIKNQAAPNKARTKVPVAAARYANWEKSFVRFQVDSLASSNPKLLEKGSDASFRTGLPRGFAFLLRLGERMRSESSHIPPLSLHAQFMRTVPALQAAVRIKHAEVPPRQRGSRSPLVVVTLVDHARAAPFSEGVPAKDA